MDWDRLWVQGVEQCGFHLCGIIVEDVFEARDNGRELANELSTEIAKKSGHGHLGGKQNSEPAQLSLVERDNALPQEKL
jgi:hypothetical protein